MSRYFNQVRRDPSRTTAGLFTGEVPLQEALGPVRHAEEITNEPVEERLQRCKKITISSGPESSAILSGDKLDAPTAESYRALRTRMVRMMAANGMRTVVISSAVPGEGKTVTAMNLGLACALLPDQRVLVVDGDLRTRGLTRLLGCSVEPGLVDILQGQAAFETAVLATNLPNFYVAAAGRVSRPTAEAYTGYRWKEFMSWARESFKIVLIDAPPIIPLADFELITAACDGVLVVVRALHTQREMLRRAVKQVDLKKFLGIVFNEVNSMDGRHYYGHRQNGDQVSPS